MTRWPAWVGAALVGCVTDRTTAAAPRSVVTLLERNDPRPLAMAAAAHHVESSVYTSLRHVPAAAPILPALAKAHVGSQRHQLGVKIDLRAIARLLDRLDVPWMVVKGPYLADVAYGRPGVRDYVDLDVVASPRDFPRVVRELQTSGCTVVRRDWQLAARQLAGEIDLVTPTGTPVDLHWELLYHGDLRRRFSLETDRMLARARVMTIGGTRVRVPDAADALIHLGVHAFKDGGVRLQWLQDIDQVVRHDPPERWGDVVHRAQDARLSLVTGTVLLRASRVLGTPVPPDVLTALLPSGWRRLMQMTDRISPPERSLARGSLASLVTRSVAGDQVATAAQLAASAAEVAGRRWRGGARAPTKPRDTVVDDNDPRNSAAALDAYLGAVAAMAEA